MRFFFYQVTLKVEAGPQEGERWLYKVRIAARTDENARRKLIGWLAKQSEPPAPPTYVAPEELAHILANWNRVRLLAIRPTEPEDLEAAFGVYAESPLFWWDHVVLPAQEETG